MSAPLIPSLIGHAPDISRFAQLLQTEHHVFTLLLAARKKYSAQVKRMHPHLVVKSLNRVTPDQLIQEIQRLETQYFDDQDRPIPPEALVVYMTIQPRDPREAWSRLTPEALKMAMLPLDHPESVRYFGNIGHRLQVHILQSPLASTLVTLDIDDKALEVSVKSLILRERLPVVAVLETRGGFHVWIRADMSKPQSRAIHEWMQLQPPHSVSRHKDGSSPIPGTIQGGRHCVRFREDFVDPVST